MGISHFSGLFVLLCVGVTGALLTLAGEHGFYRLVLPHIRRRQNLKYWLHTSQKIHRALNMTYEDVKRQRAEKEKSCNLQKSQHPQGPPAPPAPGASAKWNNETSKEAAAAAAAKDARDFKRVHFNLETLNTRRLLARMATSDAKGGGTKNEGEGPAKPRVEPTKPTAGPNSRLYENGGPAASFASLVLSLPSSSPSRPSTAPPAAPAPPLAVPAPASSTVTHPPATVAPPRPGELQELQEQIEQMREKLRTALARRAEIQTTLAKPVATVTNNPPPVTTATAVTAATAAPMTTMTTATMATGAPSTPSSTVAPVTPLPANTKCVTTMTDPPHKVLSKVRPLHSRLTNQRR